MLLEEAERRVRRPLCTLFFKICIFLSIYLFTWLCWVLVAARGMWFLDQGSNPGPFALGA